MICSQEGKHSASKGLGFTQFFIQDASPEHQLMSVSRSGPWPVAYTWLCFSWGGFACSPWAQEVGSAGGDHPVFSTAASSYATNWPHLETLTWICLSSIFLQPLLSLKFTGKLANTIQRPDWD